MKPIRFLTVAIVLLGMVATASAMTAAGVTISNQAFGNYKDAAGVALTQVSSNTVTTVVAQVAGASYNGNQTATISAMSSTVYAVEFQNTGNGPDNFTFSSTNAVSAGNGSFSVELFHDLNGDGLLDQAEIDDAVTWQDTTGAIAMNEIYRLLVRVTDTYAFGSAADMVQTHSLTATSSFVETPTDLSVTSLITLTTTIAAAAINGTTVIIGTPTYVPGSDIVYESCFTNTGTEAGHDLIFTTVMPSNTVLNTGSVSIDGGSTFETVTVITSGTSTDTYVYNSTTRTLTVLLGDLAADASICVRYSATINTGAGADDPIDFPADNPELTYDNPDGDPYDPINPTETGFPSGGPDVAQTYGVTVGPNATAATDTSALAGQANDVFNIAITITNTGNGTDSFTLSGLLENNGSDTDFITSWTFYIDTDGDGILDPGETTVVTSVDNLASGGIVNLIAVATIPGGTVDATVDGVTFSATSVGDNNESDNDTVSITCEAPFVHATTGLTKSVSPTGAQPPGTVLTYTMIVENTGSVAATDLVITDDVPANTTLVETSGTMTADNSGVVIYNTTGGIPENGVVTFTFSTLAINTPATMSFQVTID